MALISAPSLLDALRSFYCNPQHAEEAAQQLPDATLGELRESLLAVAFQLLEAQLRLQLPGSFRTEDVQALVAFVGDCHDPAALEQVVPCARLPAPVCAPCRHAPPGGGSVSQRSFLPQARGPGVMHSTGRCLSACLPVSQAHPSQDGRVVQSWDSCSPAEHPGTF